ncbi:FecR protein [Pedobacter steynii]|uniref:FecR protein n=1 Tax=Pedobacter steynii TaxID=430522 RepID=A0A1G9RFW0_9SPHI|nr:FecR family protein [Pedobacter steynii]NQX37770.1 FecR family protein [Pedobacter steynii]SDM22116.1 FecR protein [Pedobacter steynii]
MKIEAVKSLIREYNEGTLSPEQKAKLESWYINQAANSKTELDEDSENEIIQLLRSTLPLKYAKPSRTLWPRIAAVASIILCLGTAWYFYQRADSNPEVSHAKNNILPGGNKAYLTLADGQRIALTNAKNGTLAQQPGVNITKASDGEVIYSITGLKPEREGAKNYNTIETPVGGQYQIVLPDGTKVWLNAASSLKFPSTFARLVNRKVELRGEAYFEVAKNKQQPFIVKTVGQEVEVLGTHFNINTYKDEQGVKTTLLEGSVKIHNDLESKILKPGEQSTLTSRRFMVKTIDVEEAVAWKKGYFYFNNENIESIMRKLSRWYNVDVEYEGKITDEGFYGTVSQTKNISQVLNILEKTKGVHFKIEGRRVIVMK